MRRRKTALSILSANSQYLYIPSPTTKRLRKDWLWEWISCRFCWTCVQDDAEWDWAPVWLPSVTSRSVVVRPAGTYSSDTVIINVIHTAALC